MTTPSSTTRESSRADQSVGLPQNESPVWLVDTHVHLYARYSRELFLRAALRNFQDGATELGLTSAQGVLCLTEDTRYDGFTRLLEGAESLPADWRVQPNDDGISLWLLGGESGTRLLVLRGLQRVTAEGLEVSALGCAHDALPDGLPISDAVARIRDAHGWPVVPWGFGKWWFRRGRTLRDFIARTPPGEWCLGDNAGRPRGWPAPRPVEEAKTRGVLLLAGSDPLDVPQQESTVGRYGIRLDAGFDERHPGRGILDALEALCSSGRQPPIYGRRESWAGFLRNQAALRAG